MIWYEKTKLVIMLTSIKEKGKVCKLIKNKHALLYKYFKTGLKFFWVAENNFRTHLRALNVLLRANN